jgi:hypothetical protein
MTIYSENQTKPLHNFGKKFSLLNKVNKKLSFNPSKILGVKSRLSGFGGLGVPKFAVSNPAEAVRFFRAKKSSARLPSEGQ